MKNVAFFTALILCRLRNEAQLQSHKQNDDRRSEANASDGNKERGEDDGANIEDRLDKRVPREERLGRRRNGF